MNRLNQELKYEDEKQNALVERLATLVDLANQLDDVLELSRCVTHAVLCLSCQT